MKISFTKKFDKSTLKIKDEKLNLAISNVLKEILDAKNSREISSLKKLAGHKTAYRIRIQDYRIGVFISGYTAILAVFAHRKDIYKNFP